MERVLVALLRSNAHIVRINDALEKTKLARSVASITPSSSKIKHTNKRWAMEATPWDHHYSEWIVRQKRSESNK